MHLGRTLCNEGCHRKWLLPTQSTGSKYFDLFHLNMTEKRFVQSPFCWNCLPMLNVLYELLAHWICQMHPVGLRKKYVPALSAPTALLRSSVSIFCLLCLPETKPWFVLISLVEIRYQRWWQIAPFKFFSSKSYFWHIVTAHKLISQNEKITISHEQAQGDQHVLKIKALWAA